MDNVYVGIKNPKLQLHINILFSVHNYISIDKITNYITGNLFMVLHSIYGRHAHQQVTCEKYNYCHILKTKSSLQALQF